MVSALFDDHYEAFPLWREAGLSGLTCVHVDAHLDVMEDGFNPEILEKIGRARTRAELDEFRGDSDLPWGGFHCGNYLFPALLDGTVTTLIWLLPREVIKGTSLLDGSRQELQNWVDLTFEEYSSFRFEDGRVEGTLLGCRLVVCTSQSFPELTGPEKENLALDIDVDYFVRLKDDKVWQTPYQLKEALGPIEPVALSVAMSCEGGYTPVSQRYLGQVCLDLFSKGDESYRPHVEALIQAQESPDESDWSALLASVPDFMKPAVLCHMDRPAEAEVMDSEYQQKAINLASRCLQKKQYQEGLKILTVSDEPDTTRYFLSAFLAAGGTDPEVNQDQLAILLDKPGITPIEKARLWRMQAEALSKLNRPKKALSILKKALRVEPRRAELHHMMALNLRATGERAAAARSLRKALRISRGRISSLAMLLDASRLYEELGQAALARATRRQLEESDVTGYFAIESLLSRNRFG